MNVNSNALFWHYFEWNVQIIQRSYETTTSLIYWPNSACFVFSTLSQTSSWFLRGQAEDVWGYLARDSSQGDARALGSLLLWRGRCLTLLAFGRPHGLSVNPLECSCADTVSRCLRERERERGKECSCCQREEVRHGSVMMSKALIYVFGGFLLDVICLHWAQSLWLFFNRHVTHAFTVLLLCMTNLEEVIHIWLRKGISVSRSHCSAACLSGLLQSVRPEEGTRWIIWDLQEIS